MQRSFLAHQLRAVRLDRLCRSVSTTSILLATPINPTEAEDIFSVDKPPPPLATPKQHSAQRHQSKPSKQSKQSGRLQGTTWGKVLKSQQQALKSGTFGNKPVQEPMKANKDKQSPQTAPKTTSTPTSPPSNKNKSQSPAKATPTTQVTTPPPNSPTSQIKSTISSQADTATQELLGALEAKAELPQTNPSTNEQDPQQETEMDLGALGDDEWPELDLADMAAPSEWTKLMDTIQHPANDDEEVDLGDLPYPEFSEQTAQVEQPPAPPTQQPQAATEIEKETEPVEGEEQQGGDEKEDPWTLSAQLRDVLDNNVEAFDPDDNLLTDVKLDEKLSDLKQFFEEGTEDDERGNDLPSDVLNDLLGIISHQAESSGAKSEQPQRQEGFANPFVFSGETEGVGKDDFFDETSSSPSTEAASHELLSSQHDVLKHQYQELEESNARLHAEISKLRARYSGDEDLLDTYDTDETLSGSVADARSSKEYILTVEEVLERQTHNEAVLSQYMDPTFVPTRTWLQENFALNLPDPADWEPCTLPELRSSLTRHLSTNKNLSPLALHKATHQLLIHQLYNEYHSFTSFEDLNRQLKLSLVYTQEFISAMVDYLNKRIDQMDLKRPLLEVGAGSGRLSWLLEKNGLKLPIHATDHRDVNDRLPPTQHTRLGCDLSAWHSYTNVQQLSVEDAMANTTPSMVLCSYMPQGVDWTTNFHTSDTVVEYLLLCGGATAATEKFGTAATWADVAVENEADAFSHNGFGWSYQDELSRHLLDICDGDVVNGLARVASFQLARTF
eukprot:TRINITY_DN48452_c0_g1_i1.p1 TRINITY_DN48452_c0_g1~~TRINITY_DN48452_c0_g1_i1.p1  ORF type:complete len:786 (+),score=110.61 TRINITY_DN48452_c0_g1_i1:23-2380(+)